MFLFGLSWTRMIAMGMLYVVARLDVSWALVKRHIEPTNQCDDLLPPLMVPSIAQGDRSDRDLVLLR